VFITTNERDLQQNEHRNFQTKCKSHQNSKPNFFSMCLHRFHVHLYLLMKSMIILTQDRHYVNKIVKKVNNYQRVFKML